MIDIPVGMALVPLDQVLCDMSNDTGYIARAALDYYKLHYATPEEVKSINRTEKMELIGGIILISLIPIAVIIGIIRCL